MTRNEFNNKSNIISLGLIDDLDDNSEQLRGIYYKIFCKHIPQQHLDSFLAWFGHECIRIFCDENDIDIDE